MSETKHTCCGQIPKESGWLRTWKDCGKTANAERDGKWYCGIHDPVRRKEKNDATYARWREESHARIKAERIRDAAPDLLAALQKSIGIISAMGLPDEVTDNVLSEAHSAIAKAMGDKP
jgi:hypothetical protein